MKNCELCNVECELLTFHHLIPKTYHNNKKIKKMYDSKFLKNYGINVCPSCHNKIHSCIDEKNLTYVFNTKEKLINHPEIRTFILWRQKHPKFEYAISRKIKSS